MDNLIDKLIKGTQKKVSKIEGLLYSVLLDYFIDNLSIGDDKIKYTSSNINIVNRIDKALDRRLSGSLAKVAKFIFSGIKSVLVGTEKMTERYDTRETQVSPSVTNKVLKHASTTIAQKVDLEAVFSELKQLTLNEMANYDGISLRQLRGKLKEKIEEKKIVNKYFSRWTHDIYNQYQRIGGDEIRKDIGLRFAIYQGGLIATSRGFCESRNGKVFHESEIESWQGLNWEGKPETGYNPFYDLGGYNCRHRLDWISDGLAFRLRPELKQIYG